MADERYPIMFVFLYRSFYNVESAPCWLLVSLLLRFMIHPQHYNMQYSSVGKFDLRRRRLPCEPTSPFHDSFSVPCGAVQ